MKRDTHMAFDMAFPFDNEFPNGHEITLSNFSVLDSG